MATYLVTMAIDVDDATDPKDAAEAGWQRLLTLYNPIVDVRERGSLRTVSFERVGSGEWEFYA